MTGKYQLIILLACACTIFLSPNSSQGQAVFDEKPTGGSSEFEPDDAIPGQPCYDWLADRSRPPQETGFDPATGVTTEIGVATTMANVGSKYYVDSRQNAYEVAMLNAKTNMSKAIKETITSQIVSRISEGEKPPEAAASKPTDSTTDQAPPRETTLIDKILKLANAKLDKELAKEGIADIQDKEEKEAVVKKKIASSRQFQKIITNVSKLKTRGIRRFYVHEAVAEGESKAQICVVTIQSDKTMAFAEAATSGRAELAPLGKKGKSLKEQLPQRKTKEGLKNLFYSFGTIMRRDELGNFWLISFAQAAPQSSSPQAKINAIKIAEKRAKASMAMFWSEQVYFQGEEAAVESLEGFADGMEEHRYNRYFMDEMKSNSNVQITGIRQHYRWALKKSPVGPVLGVVLKWSPKSMTDYNKLGEKQKTSAAARSQTVPSLSNRSSNRGSMSGSASGGTSDDDF